jgi:hypothetical protein
MQRSVSVCPLSANRVITRCSKCALFSVAIFERWLAAGAPGQAYRKHRAFARLARHRHVAAHYARELAGDREPQACAAILLGGRRLGLGEFLE